jgi:transposase
MWYAGIDWADQHHDVVIIDERATRVGTLRVPHSAAGIRDLVAFLLGVVRRGSTGAGVGVDAVPNPAGMDTPVPVSMSVPDPEQVACIIETTHGLLITALLEAGFPVYPVNPKTVDRHRAAAGAKTDTIDAYLLAKFGRSELVDLRRLAPDNPLVAELKDLTRDQDMLIQSQTRLVNQLTACLKAYYPAALDLFTKLQQPLTIAFLCAYPTPAAARAATAAELEAFLRRVVPTYRGPHAKAQALWQQLHAPQLEADSVTVRTKARLLLALLAQLEPVLAQIAAYDAAIATLFRAHPDAALFLILPGCGERLAPRMLAEIGDDRARYAGAASLQALAGTAPRPRKSGNYATVRRRVACVKPLRNALHAFAWHSTTQEAWAEAYYRRKRQEGKSHTVAVRALANLWVRILYALWRDHAPYDPAIFLAAQQTHGRQAA